jgi:flagellar FliL protein
MADEDQDVPEEEKPADGEAGEGEDGEGGDDGKKKKLIIIIAAALILLIGGGAGVYFMGVFGGDDAAEAEEHGDDHEEEDDHGEAKDDHGKKDDKHAKKDDGHDKKAKDDGHGASKDDGYGGGEGGGPAQFLAIPTMIVNINSEDGNPRYLRLTVQLELEDPSMAPSVEAVMPRVVDQFQTYLRELRVRDLRGSAGIYRLQMELLWRVNQASKPAKIKDVLFQEILIQ